MFCPCVVWIQQAQMCLYRDRRSTRSDKALIPRQIDSEKRPSQCVMAIGWVEYWVEWILEFKQSGLPIMVQSLTVRSEELYNTWRNLSPHSHSSQWQFLCRIRTPGSAELLYSHIRTVIVSHVDVRKNKFACHLSDKTHAFGLWFIDASFVILWSRERTAHVISHMIVRCK